ncbi:hypothetical protein BBJ28_00025890, partial [Nothophytophthora sp. Chile5]
ARRALYGANCVTPPVNCPSWVCCLLPCLMRTASMQAFHAALPRESTVRRSVAAAQQQQGQPAMRRMRMDAMSLVYGDVVELKAGDVAGADLRVLECSNDCVVDQTTLAGDEEEEDQNPRKRVGRKRVTTVSPLLHLHQDLLRCGNIVPMATRVLQGTAVCVVVATGDNTLWGRLIAQHEWPPVTGTRSKQSNKGDEEEQTSLIV